MLLVYVKIEKCNRLLIILQIRTKMAVNREEVERCSEELLKEAMRLKKCFDGPFVRYRSAFQSRLLTPTEWEQFEAFLRELEELYKRRMYAFQAFLDNEQPWDTNSLKRHVAEINLDIERVIKNWIALIGKIERRA